MRIAGTIARTVSSSSAARWRFRADDAIQSLARDADQWPEADEAPDLARNVRCRMFGRKPHVYRVLFEINGEVVQDHGRHSGAFPGRVLRAGRR